MAAGLTCTGQPAAAWTVIRVTTRRSIKRPSPSTPQVRRVAAPTPSPRRAPSCGASLGVTLPSSLPEPLVDEGDDAETCPSRPCLVDPSLQNTRRYPLEMLLFFQGVAGGPTGAGRVAESSPPSRPAKEKYCPYVGGKYSSQYVIENQSSAGGYVFYHDVTSRKISHWKGRLMTSCRP